LQGKYWALVELLSQDWFAVSTIHHNDVLDTTFVWCRRHPIVFRHSNRQILILSFGIPLWHMMSCFSLGLK
jgi:hypothetical protein